MTNKYPHDDDWGDAEMAKARKVARQMDAIIDAITAPRSEPKTLYEFETVCSRCGHREIWMAKHEPDHAEYVVPGCAFCGEK